MLPLSEGVMTICSPEAGNITCRGWTNRHVTLTQGQQGQKLFYYTEPIVKQIRGIPDDKRMTSEDTMNALQVSNFGPIKIHTQPMNVNEV